MVGGRGHAVQWTPCQHGRVTGRSALRPVPVPPDEAVLSLLDAVDEALAGGPPLLPYAVGTPVPEPAGRPTPGTALVVGTSGSTGRPKLAMLSPTALRSSAQATHEFLGGPGTWLLALPAHHVAGVQVLVRSVLARTRPVVVDLSGGFTARGFTEATRRLDEGRRYTAVVPTQLARLLADRAAAEALAGYDAVLVGGAPSPPALLRRARAAGVRAVTTYGMSETAGGCVYAGRPLSCTRVRLGADGRLHLGGDTVALGYLGDPELTARAFSDDGVRWFHTDDVGHLDEEGSWHVDGRVDDLVITGGLKVAPRLVEDAIVEHVDAAVEAVVVGTPDPEWGQAVSVAVVLDPARRGPAPTVADLRAQLRGILPDHALPRRLVVVPAIPVTGPGKPDRAAVAVLFA
jgi:O-succinylbenzoic acid--CoA ligase